MKVKNYIKFVNESKHLDIDDVKNFFADIMDEFNIHLNITQDDFSTIGGYPSIFNIETDFLSGEEIDSKIDLRPWSRFSKIIEVIESRLSDYNPYSQGYPLVWRTRSKVVANGDKKKLMIRCDLVYKNKNENETA